MIGSSHEVESSAESNVGMRVVFAVSAEGHAQPGRELLLLRTRGHEVILLLITER